GPQPGEDTSDGAGVSGSFFFTIRSFLIILDLQYIIIFQNNQINIPMIPLCPRMTDYGTDPSCHLGRDMPINRFSALWICSNSLVLCIRIFSVSWPSLISLG